MAKKIHTKFDKGGTPPDAVDIAVAGASLPQKAEPTTQASQDSPSSTSGKKRTRKRNKSKTGTDYSNVPEKAKEPGITVKEEEKPVKAKPNKVKKFDEDQNNHTEKDDDDQEEAHKSKKHKPNHQHRDQPKTVEFYSDDDEDSNFKESRTPITSFSNHTSLKMKAQSLLSTRQTLPVYKSQTEIMTHLQKNQVTILIGETGSGKSTQIPQFLLTSLAAQNNKKKSKAIAVTQPRRVAAINLATRVSEEHGCSVGSEVGYSVRFDTTASHRTKLKYLTDGMLLRECILDPELSAYEVIIIDEAHERTVLTDLLMGFLKELLARRRDDLKVIVMSATLDAERFSRFFSDAEILFIEGRKFKVDRYYLNNPVDDIVDSAIRSIVQLNQREMQGDVLVFLPGQEEIDKAVGLLERLAHDLPKDAPLIVPFPLYASLSPTDQAKVFLPLKPRRRKVILSTNIAETSVTVPGVRYVIDSGLRKVKVWRHSLGLSTLLTAPISKAAAMQRAGRAGREAEGKVFRLYTEKDYLALPEQTEPEISRMNVTSPVLTLKELGVEDVLNWSWLETPGEDSLISSLTQLYQLKALDDAGKITKLGHEMAILPLEPQHAAILIKAHREYHCLSPVIDIIACLSVDNLILNPSSEIRDDVNERRRAVCGLGVKYGDLIMLKELLDGYFQFTGKEAKEERANWCRDLAVSARGFRNVLKIRDQIRQYMVNLTKDKQLFDMEEKTEEEEEDNGIEYTKALDIPSILKSFLSCLIQNTAIGHPDRSYRTTTSGNLIAIHPSSLLFGQKCDGILFMDYVYTTRGYARGVSKVDLSWVLECGGMPAVGAAKVSLNDN